MHVEMHNAFEKVNEKSSFDIKFVNMIMHFDMHTI